MSATHTLLRRQMKRLGLSEDAPPSGEEWRSFLERVNVAYSQTDQDRYTQERSLLLSSREMHQLHADLQRSDGNLRTLVERSPDAICVAGLDDCIQYVNPALVRCLGYSDASELLGRSALSVLLHPDDRQRVAEARARRLAGELMDSIAARWVCRDGSVIFIEALSTMVDFDGKAASLITARDVTEKRQLEEQLRHAQKMDAVGKLAGGVAHDFNNLLAVILGCASMVTDDLVGAPEEVRVELREITAAARRAAALTEQLLAFSRTQPRSPAILDLNTVVIQIRPMLDRLIEERISMRTELTPIGSIEADARHVEQVLLNLVVNARDAMPGGGKMTIETTSVDLDAAQAGAIGAKPGAYVALTVTDTGCGMDAATRAQIFEPFFTTKPVGEGTGLGLSTVFGIVQQSGGAIAVESEPGRGTTFRVFFPRVRHPAVAPPAPSLAPVMEKGSGTVLLVEDDPQVRTVVQRALTRCGYTVIPTLGPLDALEALRGRTSVDLVVTDLVMPEMDGRSMAALALAQYPQLRFLFMSGYPEHVAVKGAPFGPGDRFLRKPFTPYQLASAVREALGPEAAAR